MAVDVADGKLEELMTACDRLNTLKELRQKYAYGTFGSTPLAGKTQQADAFGHIDIACNVE
jgi:hypothetical protein